jgi:hypothetical protein
MPTNYSWLAYFFQIFDNKDIVINDNIFTVKVEPHVNY